MLGVVTTTKSDITEIVSERASGRELESVKKRFRESGREKQRDLSN